MNNWRRTRIDETASIREAIKIIDAGAAQIGIVTDASDVLLGTLTDGDIRRALLRGIDLDSPASSVMNHKPVSLPVEQAHLAGQLFRKHKIRQIPVVDSGHSVVQLLLNETSSSSQHANEVVLMAGGLGTRLGDLTRNTPKPLLHVGKKPILETIIERFLGHGYRNFHLSVNYHADQIIEHFGDGSAWGAQISYIRETERMGTAGALGLIEERPTQPFFVMNGDLLTKADFNRMMRSHVKQEVTATMAVREYDIQIPFGVVETNGQRVERIVEKPVKRYFVNAGIYVLDPVVLDFVPHGQYLDMPDLLHVLLTKHRPVSRFPVHEFWLDIGDKAEFQRANDLFSAEFDE